MRGVNLTLSNPGKLGFFGSLGGFKIVSLGSVSTLVSVATRIYSNEVFYSAGSSGHSVGTNAFSAFVREPTT